MKTWQGRIRAPLDPVFERFNSSVDQDRRLAPYDVRVSRAHVRALARAGVIGEADADRMVAALDEIGAEIASGDFAWHDELEDVHTHIESRLRSKLGVLADALHTGRSRNDQVAADLRLYVLDRTHAIMAAILALQESLLGLAGRYREAMMPAYTHLQQAQPVIIAQPLLAYVEMLGRDWERFADGLRRTDRSPLGSGAIAGSTFPLDRELLARSAGFGRASTNSIDAVGDRDFLVEFVFDCALCLTHLSRLAEDVILWSSTEFRFLHLPDAFSTGSSMMPQKKNPDVGELVRGKAATVLGDVTAALALVKGLPGGYNRDLQEDKTPLFHAGDTLAQCLQVLTAMVPCLEFDVARTEQAISSFTLATDLADYLVQQGIPFREAHGVVGALVAECLEAGRELSDLSLEELRAASPAFAEMPDLTPAASVRRKRTSGSTHPDEVRHQLDAWQGLIRERMVAAGMEDA
jgi:argininosuccinate lyase